jgi:hypothetical protein
MVINEWTEPRCTVASIVGNNITLATLCGMHLWSANYERVLPPPVRIEAAPPAAPLARGEFWHDVEKGWYILIEITKLRDWLMCGLRCFMS